MTTAAQEGLPALATDAEIAELRRLASSHGVLHWPMLLRVLARLEAAERQVKRVRGALDSRIEELDAAMVNGQGEHGKSGYMRETIWNGWVGEISGLRRLRGLMKTLDEHAALEAKP